MKARSAVPGRCRRRSLALVFGSWLCFALVPLSAAEYRVGPGQPLADPNDVPWESLQAGDMVFIYWRKEPYRSKWVICARGTVDRPITVRGMPGDQGALPVIEGRDASTRKELDYWHEQRSVIKIGGANVPADVVPAHIIVEGLEVRGGRPPFAYRGRAGVAGYAEFAAGIFVEKGEHIVIRNCVLTDNANGLLVASQAKDVLVEHSWFHGNGVGDSVYAHNVYTSAAGMTFQFNRFGPLRAGCPGNNLKDRSAGLVVHCNWIEGGNQQLDLVDAEDRESLRADPRYQEVLVHGNILIKRAEDGRDDLVHFGGDSGKKDWYRRGPLRFYQNTVVTHRPGSTTLFRLSDQAQVVDARNNIFAAVNGGRFSILEADGQVRLGDNWITDGWQQNEGRKRGLVSVVGKLTTGTEPGFRNVSQSDFRLLVDSPCARAAEPLPAGVMPDKFLTEEYSPHLLRQDLRRKPDELLLLPALGAFRGIPR